MQQLLNDLSTEFVAAERRHTGTPAFVARVQPQWVAMESSA